MPDRRQQGHPAQGPPRHRGRKDEFVDKWKNCQITNAEGRTGGIPEALKGADVLHRPLQAGPGHDPARVDQAAWPTDPIVFACANPIPEIWPWDAKEAGAAVVATGRSDFPNQVNNSLGFPGIFRGTLDVRAKTITDEMCIAAAEELAKVAEDKGLRADYIMPTMDDWEVFPREAAAVAMKAIEQGIALRTDLTFEQEVAEATAIIARARGMVQDQMALGYIPMPEGSRAPAPTKAAAKAVARGAGDYAGEIADKAVDAHRAGRREDRRGDGRPPSTRPPTPSRRPRMKKDDGVTDAEVVAEEPPEWKPPAAEPEPPAGARRRTSSGAGGAALSGRPAPSVLMGKGPS